MKPSEDVKYSRDDYLMLMAEPVLEGTDIKV